MAVRSASQRSRKGSKQLRRYAPRLPPEERREQLLDAALGVIVEKGYEGISMEAVARAAGVTRPVVYDHFPNLAALLQALFAREERYSLEQLAEVIPAVPSANDPAHVLATSVRRFLEAIGERPATWRLILLPSEGTPADVRDHVEDNRTRILEQIALFVEAARAQRSLPPELDVDLCARVIRDLGEEAGRMVLTDPEHYSPERYERFVASMLKLLGAG